jgi:hypothetical protein
MSIDNSEVRVADPTTGGEKGQKDAVLGDIDPRALMEVAQVCGFGRKKYARLNYLRGYNWSSSYDALQRHLHLFWDREERDEESQLHHLAHAAWHCFALFSFALRGLGTDDRPFAPPVEETPTTPKASRAKRTRK